MHFQKPMLGIPLDWSNPLNKDLAMHLAMNEGHGDVVRDLSMNGNHGTLKNMAFPSTVASGWNPGRTGVGLKFDGTDDYISFPEITFEDNTPWTACYWCKMGIVTNMGIIGKYDDDNYMLYHYPTGAPSGFYTIRDSLGNSIRWTYSEWDVRWHHYCVKTNGDGKFGLFIDGISYGTQNEDAGGTGFIFSSISEVHTAAVDFKGSIDQVRIHNRALTAKEVQNYYINPWQVYLDEEGM